MIPYLILPPNIVLLLIFVYCGIPWTNYCIWCKSLDVGDITQEVYNAIIAEEKTNRTIEEMIVSNHNKMGTDKKFELQNDVRAKFEFPEIVDQIVNALSQASQNKDTFELIMPEPLQQILQKYKRRQFIECGSMVGLQFYKLEQYWQIIEPTGIVREHYDAYKYFLWNLEVITKISLPDFLKQNNRNPFYGLHNRILGKDESYFLGCFGLQDKQGFNKNNYKLINSTLKMLGSMDEAPKELYSLLDLCSSQYGRAKKDKLFASSTQNKSPGLFDKYEKIKSEAALRLHKENRDYQLKKLHDKSKNNKGK